MAWAVASNLGIPAEDDALVKRLTLASLLLHFAGLAFCLFGLASCQSLWHSMKSAAAPAGGAAGGAALGMTMGPGGAIGGAAVGALVGDGLEENASLRSGETIGEEALDKQAEFWRGRAVKATEAVTLAEQANEALKQAVKWGLLALAGLFLFRNRHNFKELGFVKGLTHALLGGKVCKS